VVAELMVDPSEVRPDSSKSNEMKNKEGTVIFKKRTPYTLKHIPYE
jgi:hypothetical protein